MLLERGAAVGGVAEAEPGAGLTPEAAAVEVAAGLRACGRGKLGFEEAAGGLEQLIKPAAGVLRFGLRVGSLGKRDARLFGEPFHRLGEAQALGEHNEFENVAVLAGREIKPGALVVIDEKRRGPLLLEGR